MASQPIYQFYAELSDYKPKIWRRFQVMQNITLARLGYIVMTLFEMQGSHLFCLEVPHRENYIRYRDKIGDSATDRSIAFLQEKVRYELPNEWAEEYNDTQPFDACSSKLYHALECEGDQVTMQYDYGNGWEIELTVERIFRDHELPGKALPQVLDGAGYGIIEDCGGVSGLKDIAKAFKKHSGVDYRSYVEWLGVEDLDLTKFDLADMNFRVKKVPRIYSDAYELDLQPTPYSMRILLRDYLK